MCGGVTYLSGIAVDYQSSCVDPRYIGHTQYIQSNSPKSSRWWSFRATLRHSVSAWACLHIIHACEVATSSIRRTKPVVAKMGADTI